MQKDLAKSWRQLVRWLVTDVPARVTVESESTEDPTQVRLIVKARDEEFKPLDNAVARLTVRPVRFCCRNPGISRMRPPARIRSNSQQSHPRPSLANTRPRM